MINLLIVLFFSTFVSEDITCITSGIFAKEGKLPLILAITVTGLGIFIGDLLLYLVGFFFHNLLNKFVNIKLWEEKLISQNLYHHWKSNFIFSIFISRFLPGTRLPLYLLSGYFRLPFFVFLTTSFIAVSIWTTTIVSLVYIYGKWIITNIGNRSQWWILVFIGFSFYFFLKGIQFFLIPTKRETFYLQCLKYTRLEFWPSFLFYTPLVPYFIYLMFKYKGIRYLTATNPGIIASGIAGESKSEILKLIPKHSISKSLLIKTDTQKKLERVKSWLQKENLRYPIIAKPDKGERGFLVKKIKSKTELNQLFQNFPIDWLLQEWIEGPYEVGIFYYRLPEKTSGQIFSVTNKIFPTITGDGVSTLETLIKNHKRYRFQSESHKKNNQKNLQMILPKGKTIPIGSIGNHIQGCMFQDGSHLLTKKLERELIKIADNTKGFYIGRFDIRYSNPNQFQEGKGFKIIELNGVTSESTNLYDPNFSIRQSYSILFKQWKLIFEIGHSNYKRGIPLFSYEKLFQLVKNHNAYRKKFNLLERNL
ncbi:DedA family protein [Leptospira bouyouniensis]|uniref:DedA family protein n=1 Tax=Leptospira bouyouniensis TaxID=2484911 RepID=UPI001090BCEC|nr:VTT domain-containing protein [Leptospira bouyouniensis]TGM81069.1 SNARE-like domain protein [Leptospira bouyouniensis]